MLVFLPILLLLTAALGGVILLLLKRGGGFFWAIAFIATLTVWVVTLVIPANSVQPVVLRNWLPFTQIYTGLSFTVDQISSTFSFSLAGLLLAFVITSTIRLQSATQSRDSILVLIFGALGILVLVSGDPLSLILSWVLLDLVTLSVELGFSGEHRQSQKSILAFAIKLLGTMVLISGIIILGGKGINFDLTNIPAELSFVFVLSAIFRLWGGIFSFGGSRDDSDFARDGIIQLISFSTGLALLTRIPIATHPAAWQNWSFLGVVLLALWSAFRNLKTADPRKGLPYFLIGGSSLAILSALNGQSLAALAWGCLVILIGGNFILFEKFYRYQIIVIILGMVVGIGLPFTLGSMGWVGLFNQHSMVGILVLVCFPGWIAGMILGILRSETRTDQFERPIAFIHIIGISLLILSEILLSLRFIGDLSSLRYWYPPVFVTVITVVFVILLPRLKGRIKIVSNFSARMEKYSWLQTASRFKFINQVLKWLFGLSEMVVQIITDVLEGEGGVIWTLVLLAILISVLVPGGK